MGFLDVVLFAFFLNQNHGVCCGAFLAGAFFFFVTCPASKKVIFCVFFENGRDAH